MKMDALTVMACARLQREANLLSNDVKTAGGQGEVEVGVALLTVAVLKLASAHAPDVEELFRELWEEAKNGEDGEAGSRDPS